MPIAPQPTTNRRTQEANSSIIPEAPLKMGRDKKIMFACIVMVSLAMASMATIADDEKDCADQLTNLASCIPFVSGSAKNPTPDCCQATQKMKASQPKCLCVLIKESTDPSMGLPINTTLALQMPTACNIDASVSNCPKLLNLAADSPDAKIFKEAGKDSSTAATTNTTTTSPSSASATSGSTATTPTTSSADSGSKTDTNDNNKATTSSSSSSDGAKMMVSYGTPSSFCLTIASYALLIMFM